MMLTMEIDRTYERKDGNNVPTASKADDAKESNDEESSRASEDTDSTSCPLFMSGLPRNFATNPQLAAIASLSQDESIENDDEDLPKPCNPSKIDFKAPPSLKKTASTIGSVSIETNTRHNNFRSTRRHTRRRQDRASPYPRYQNNEPKPKQTTVGEITLFMNMWKP